MGVNSGSPTFLQQATISYSDFGRLVRFEKKKQGKLDFGHKMRLSGVAFVATLVILAKASPQGINFGGSSSSEKEEDIANRNYGQQSAPQIQQHQNQQCCCIPQQQQCLQNQHFTQGDDLVGEGLINERIVNRRGSAAMMITLRTLTTTSACSSGILVAASRSHPLLLSSLLVVGSRAAVRLQFMETSNAGREPTEDQFEDFLKESQVPESSRGPV